MNRTAYKNRHIKEHYDRINLVIPKLGGKISPPSGIFLMKNWLSYKDAISIEESIPNKETKRILTAAELPKLGEPATLQSEDLPHRIRTDYR